MVPSLTPYDLPFPQNGGSICPQYTREWPYLRNGWSDTLYVWFSSRVRFSGSADRMALFLATSNPSWRIISDGHISATAHNSIHLYSAHRAVIFAIVQLSCSGRERTVYGRTLCRSCGLMSPFVRDRQFRPTNQTFITRYQQSLMTS